jgi:hypothetical protein
MSFTPTEIEITKHILNLRLPMNLTFVKIADSWPASIDDVALELIGDGNTNLI